MKNALFTALASLGCLALAIWLADQYIATGDVTYLFFFNLSQVGLFFGAVTAMNVAVIALERLPYFERRNG